MLNLVELGSNYPLFLLLCLKRACSSFQDKSPDFDRKEDISSDFKKDSSFEEAQGPKQSKTRQKREREKKGCTAVHQYPA